MFLLCSRNIVLPPFGHSFSVFHCVLRSTHFFFSILHYSSVLGFLFASRFSFGGFLFASSVIYLLSSGVAITYHLLGLDNSSSTGIGIVRIIRWACLWRISGWCCGCDPVRAASPTAWPTAWQATSPNSPGSSIIILSSSLASTSLAFSALTRSFIFFGHY